MRRGAQQCQACYAADLRPRAADATTCPICGEPKHRQSAQCRSCHLAGHRQPESYINRECEECGQPMRVHRAELAAGWGRYCSRPCARSGSATRKATRPYVTCHVCGKRFRKYEAEIRKNRGGFRFCSGECWYSWNQRDNHYEWAGGQHDRQNPDGVAWRKAVLERDNYKCRWSAHGSCRISAAARSSSESRTSWGMRYLCSMGHTTPASTFGKNYGPTQRAAGPNRAVTAPSPPTDADAL